MGAIGLLLTAVGAVLYWGVTADASGINVDFIGIVLMVVGVIGVILSVVRGTFLTVRREPDPAETRTVEEHHHH